VSWAHSGPHTDLLAFRDQLEAGKEAGSALLAEQRTKQERQKRGRQQSGEENPQRRKKREARAEARSQERAQRNTHAAAAEIQLPTIRAAEQEEEEEEAAGGVASLTVGLGGQRQREGVREVHKDRQLL